LTNLLSDPTAAQPTSLSLQSMIDAQNALAHIFQDGNLDRSLHIPPDLMHLLSQLNSQASSSQSVSPSNPGLMEADSQTPETAVTSLQPSISAQSTTSSVSSANKRKRAAVDDAKPEPSGRRVSSKRTTSKEPTTISAFVGMTGALGGITTALNQNITQGDIPTVQSAVAIISEVDWLSDEDRGLLVNYYSRNPTAAAGLIGLNSNTLKITLKSCIELIRSNVMSM